MKPFLQNINQVEVSVNTYLDIKRREEKGREEEKSWMLAVVSRKFSNKEDVRIERERERTHTFAHGISR